MKNPLDIAVIGRLPNASPVDEMKRLRGLIEALPPSVHILEFWAHHYNGNEFPEGDGENLYYQVRDTQMVRALKLFARMRELACICYWLPSRFSGPLPPHKQMQKLREHLRGAGGWDGVYIDGVPPFGSETVDSESWLKELRAVLTQDMGAPPVIVVHSSGTLEPGSWARYADVIYTGEFGEGPHPTQGWRVPWARGTWWHLDGPNDPQWLTYAVKCLWTRTWPALKRTPELCGATPWAEWMRQSGTVGSLRLWCVHDVPQLYTEVDAIRARYRG